MPSELLCDYHVDIVSEDLTTSYQIRHGSYPRL
jgi:hypothetical protein